MSSVPPPRLGKTTEQLMASSANFSESSVKEALYAHLQFVVDSSPKGGKLIVSVMILIQPLGLMKMSLALVALTQETEAHQCP